MLVAQLHLGLEWAPLNEKIEDPQYVDRVQEPGFEMVAGCTVLSAEEYLGEAAYKAAAAGNETAHVLPKGLDGPAAFLDLMDVAANFDRAEHLREVTHEVAADHGRVEGLGVNFQRVQRVDFAGETPDRGSAP